MKKRILFAVLFVAFVGLGVGITMALTGKSDPVIAEAAREEPTVPAEMVETEVEPVTPENVEEAAEETLETIDLDTLLEKSPQEVADYLTERVWADFQPGWIHRVTFAVHDSDNENLGVLPHGMAIPLNQENHFWIYVDENLNVIKQISIQKNENGEVVQASAASENRIWSFLEELTSVEAISEWSSYVLVRPDFNLQKELDQFAKLNGEIESGLIELEDGREAIVFRYVDTDFPPEGVKSVDFELKITGAEIIITFEPVSGRCISYAMTYSFEDGTKRVVNFKEISYSYEPPSEEALKFLSSVEQ